MDNLPKENRKNDGRRRFPWWLLFVGFASGVLVTLALTAGRGGSTVTVYSSAPEDILRQATMLVHEATLNAQAPRGSATLDPFLATATAYILEATQQAASPNAIDPYFATATEMVAQMTQQAMTATPGTVTLQAITPGSS